MKKAKIIILAVVLVLAAVAVGVYFYLYPAGDTASKYIKKVEKADFYENNLDSAIPQTEIYNIIKDHFTGELPQGKTVKKAIVIGYDGCRLDIVNTANDGAINYLLNNGGKAYISYCGGVKYPKKNTQDTSTAPGWCSMLTGQWADVHGITGNDIVKSNDHLTLLTSLVEDKTINSSAFYVSWSGHFSRDNSTYHDEKQYTEDNNLNVAFICSDDDEGTKTVTLSDIENPDCSDFIFSIFEYCDHEGHGKGFYTEKASYKNAFKEADCTALEVVEKIMARENYDNEDWLIILTTDHGGYGRGHGGKTIQERDTFIVVNKGILYTVTTEVIL